MQKVYSLDELAEFTRNEKQLIESLGIESNVEEEITVSPRTHVINNILNYSRALSVRDTDTLGKVDMVLN